MTLGAAGDRRGHLDKLDAKTITIACAADRNQRRRPVHYWMSRHYLASSICSVSVFWVGDAGASVDESRAPLPANVL